MRKIMTTSKKKSKSSDNENKQYIVVALENRLIIFFHVNVITWKNCKNHACQTTVQHFIRRRRIYDPVSVYLFFLYISTYWKCFTSCNIKSAVLCIIPFVDWVFNPSGPSYISSRPICNWATNHTLPKCPFGSTGPSVYIEVVIQ